jgi:hypothetical protein
MVFDPGALVCRWTFGSQVDWLKGFPGVPPPGTPKNKCDKCASVTSPITTGVFCTFTSVYASVCMCTQMCTLAGWEGLAHGIAPGG